MLYDVDGFVAALAPHVEKYKHDNSWVSWWTKDDVYNSWRMYKTAGTSSLGFLLLGDTKIRKDATLLMNFGTATAHDIQEEPERRLVAMLSDRRRMISRGTAGVHYQPAKGTGSILSDNKWTPMLNDSFMLGGIHAGQNFILAEDDFFGQTQRRPATSAKEKWLYYFQKNKVTFWNDQFGPRVFARECICLKAAGYRPSFNNLQLGFEKGAGTLNFDKCLRVLNTSGFTNKNKALLMKSISDFLFDDANALVYN